MPKSIPQCIVLEFPSISTAARSWLNKYFWEIETKIGSDDCIPHEIVKTGCGYFMIQVQTDLLHRKYKQSQSY